ncbi:MAG: 50S ribosomal protein L22 [Candidatus Liptonbacteria bacterium]|nr:50S ribosomal protein L22 [Candidatus Liptonbacteria bacterium]
MNTQTAKLKYLKVAPRKVRLVADSLRGMSVNEAEAVLLMQPKRPGRPLLKLLRSAVANARNNQKLGTDNLVIQSIVVNQGPMLKRHLPRARGMASPIQKKMSHVTLVIAESGKAAKNKFKIVVRKKLKDKDIKETAAKAKMKEREPKTEERQAQKREEKPGMLRRFFRRKVV